jgi:hypothetical protein
VAGETGGHDLVGIHHRHAEPDEVVDHGDDLARVAEEDLAHAEHHGEGKGEDDDQEVPEHPCEDVGRVRDHPTNNRAAARITNSGHRW